MEITIKALVKRKAFNVGKVEFEETEFERTFVLDSEENMDERVKEKIAIYNKQNHQSKFEFVGPCRVTERK